MAEGPEIKVRYTADVTDLKKGSAEAKQVVQSVEPEVKKTSRSFEDYSEVLKKGAAIAGGTFVTAAIAVATAVSNANEQVKALDKSVRISSGSNENYTANLSALQNISDRYQQSIFGLASGFNELTRETRGTINEGSATALMFDQLVNVSDKTGFSIDETTGSLGGFIDKMKQGTVDSTNLTNELDKRLYEAFVKVSEGMGLTVAELNEVLKTSDEAVATVLPQLVSGLSDALGSVPQKDAADLAEKIEYAKSKLTVFLDGLFQTSGAKSVLAQGAADAGDLLSALDKINRSHGLMAAGGAAIVAGSVKVASAVTGQDLNYDPMGYMAAQELTNQRSALGAATKYAGGKSIGWNQKSENQYKLPSEYTKEDFDIAAAAYQNRIEAEAKANQKLIAEAKRQAAERKRENDAINRKEIEESNQRIKDGVFAAEQAAEEAYRKNNGILGPIGQLQKTGIVDNRTRSGEKTGQSFSQSGGDPIDFKKTTDQIAGMTEAWWKEKQAKDANIASTNDLAIRMENLGEQMSAIMDQGKIEFFTGLGESLGELAVDTGNLESAGAKIGRIMGEMIQGIGKAIIAYAMTMEGLKTAMKAAFASPWVALAVGVAAVAAGQAVKASAQKQSNQASQRFWTGGIVDGPAGIDMVPTKLSKNEMVLTEGDQSRLWGVVRGTNSGMGMRTPFSGSGSDMAIQVEMEYRMSGSDIYVSSRKGKRKHDYFS